jgi:hypothetical protein
MKPGILTIVAPPQVRPTFELELTDEPDEVTRRLRRRLADCPRCTGTSVGRHAELFVPEAERRVWSPWLSVTTETAADGGSIVRGRFAPHPHVWTLYMFLAFGLGFGLLVGAAWGYAQWAMGEAPWALVSLPLGLLLAGGLYLVSLTGQRLGAGQIDHLADALTELVAPDEAAKKKKPASGRS